MQKILAFIRNDVRRALTIAVAAVIATAALVGFYNDCLTTETSPNAIVSLELAGSYDLADKVVEAWHGVMYEVKFAIYTDFGFIFAYTFALLVLLITAERSIQNATIEIWKTPALITKIAFALPWVAFWCDTFENIFMLVFLSRQTPIVYYLFFVLAYTKFISIVLVLVYCVAAPMVHRHVLKASRLYAPGLVTVLISYFVFIRLDQGQDIMIQVIESSGPIAWSLVCSFLWIWYIWYSSRLVGYAKMQQPGRLIPTSYHKHFPRLLAFNGLVSLQAASLALPTLGGLSASSLLIFVIVQNGVYFLWDDYVDNKRWYSLTLVILFSIGYGGLLTWIAIDIDKGVRNQIALLIVDGVIYVIALFVVWLWIRRRDHLGEELIPDPCEKPDPCKGPVVYEDYLKIFRIKVLALPRLVFNKEKPWFLTFNLLAIFGLILYELGFAWLDFADRMGPLAFVLLAFGILVGLSNMITIFSIYRRTNFFFVFLVWAFVVGFIYDPFKVRLVDSPPTPRTDMIQYFDSWVQHRKTEIDTSTTFPVYVVIADGGASRSGYWVSSVLSELQDSSIERRNDNAARTIFSDHLLCLAGASGGSVGNAAFYAMLKSREIDGVSSRPDYWEQSRSFLKNDFLTPVLTHWLGTDIFQHLVPFKIAEDRAGILEKGMERFAAKSNLRYNVPFDQVIDQSGKLPMLFINVTSLHKGLPAVVSSVPVESFSQRVDVIKQLEDSKLGTINYSTAVILGARFPYVSPAGRIDNEYYVDGGYFDNTGAGIVHEALQKVELIMKQRADTLRKQFKKDHSTDTSLLKTYGKLRFKLLYLSNSPFDPVPDNSRCSGYKAPTKKIHPLSNDLAAPILTVLGTYGSQTDVNNRRLENFMSRFQQGGKMQTVNLYSEGDKKIYPMNWVISEYNLTRMDNRLREAKQELKAILDFE